jgi:hypothetical protein
MVQLFDFKERFYQIEAKALPGQNDSNPMMRVHSCQGRRVAATISLDDAKPAKTGPGRLQSTSRSATLSAKVSKS